MGARADAAVIVQVFADDSYQGTADLTSAPHPALSPEGRG